MLFIEQIMSDMQRVFGLPVTLETHTSIIRGLLRGKDTGAIRRWIVEMEKKQGSIRPSLDQWHILFEHCVSHRTIADMWAALRYLRASGCLPSNATYKFLVRRLFREPPSEHLPWVLRITQQTILARSPFDEALLTMMVEGFTSQGRHQDAADVESAYRNRTLRAKSAIWRVDREWNKQIKEAFQREGKVAALQLYESLRSRGLQASDTTLLALLSHSDRIEDLISVEEHMGIRAGPYVWLALINNAATARKPWVALTLYDEAKAAGVDVTLLAEPVVRTLCTNSIRAPDEATIDRALQIYRDFYAGEIPKRWATKTTTHVSLYQTLLRTLASNRNRDKYFPVIIELLADMRERKVLQDATMTASTAVLLLRGSASVQEAQQIYAAIRSHDHAPLDGPGYLAVLAALSEQMADEITPLLHEYFRIARHMREAGHPMSPDVYTHIFRQITRLAIHTPSSAPDYIPRLQQLLTTLRHAHHLLTIDASVTPDTPCWNHLIEAYQRSGSFKDATRVWDSLYLSGRVDSSSFNVIFAACARAGAVHAAKEVHRKLRADGYQLSQENWYTWLQCLCHLGELDEATRQLCVEMPSGRDNVRPDVNSARIVIGSTQKQQTVEEMRKRIQRYLPGLWDQLPPELAGTD
ncbi:hypothetical protein FA95DRAFT_1495808 [Auriscalpium vulgare]|uniref:Uncharacterized protein n=1 Tax=Auriscalpium vulgare TaxID=40419 RepID=A0ACB8RMM3_9AGAM|nr:hypothetical protein FA95DRAFT_1495808 [Auriscalpium vulgare]